jgi:hypothetical protein
MKSSRGYIVLGIVLVALGVLFLLQNFDLLNFNLIGGLVWGLVFGIAGLVFLGVFVTNIHENWWAVIPGFVLLGLAFLIAFGETLGAAAGGFFLGAIGLSFLVIYLVRREFWWAIIPAGALLTLAVIATLADRLPGMVSGSLLFLGLGLTFGLVYLAPAPGPRKTWALIPGGILVVIGLLMMFAPGGFIITYINYIWPIALIVGGGILVVRALLKRGQ